MSFGMFCGVTGADGLDSTIAFVSCWGLTGVAVCSGTLARWQQATPLKRSKTADWLKPLKQFLHRQLDIAENGS